MKRIKITEIESRKVVTKDWGNYAFVGYTVSVDYHKVEKFKILYFLPPTFFLLKNCNAKHIMLKLPF